MAIIDHMDAASLTIDAEEFHAKYAAAEAKSAVTQERFHPIILFFPFFLWVAVAVDVWSRMREKKKEIAR